MINTKLRHMVEIDKNKSFEIFNKIFIYRVTLNKRICWEAFFKKK